MKTVLVIVGRILVVAVFAALCVLAGRCFGKVMYRATDIVAPAGSK